MAVQMSYGGFAFEPVPQLTLSIQHVRDDAGNLINMKHVASLQGQLVSLGKTNQGIAGLSDQMDDMRIHLGNCTGCARFQLICDGTTTLIDTYAKPNNLTFSPSSDNWVFTVNYSVELEWDAISDQVLMAATGINKACWQCLSQTNESWSIQQVESPAPYNTPFTCTSGIPQVLEISHEVSARGYNCCISGGVETLGYVNAKNWVEQRLGFSTAILSDISGLTFRLTPSAFTAYDHNRQININKSAGEYAVTETWTVVGDSGARAYLEDYTSETNTDSSSRFSTVSIQGSIRGLETRDVVHDLVTPKFENATVGWLTIEPTLYLRASCLSESLCPLNTQPISTSVTKNVSNGVINYNYTYNTKPQLISGSLSESVNVSDTLKSSQIIQVGIIGRRAGPILYDTRQNNARERNVSIAVTMAQPTGCYNATGDVCTWFDALYTNPPTSGVNRLLCCLERNLSGIASKYHVTSQGSDWDPINGQYTHNVTWQYETPCASVTAPGSFCS